MVLPAAVCGEVMIDQLWYSKRCRYNGYINLIGTRRLPGFLEVTISSNLIDIHNHSLVNMHEIF